MRYLARSDWAFLALIFLFSAVPSLGGLLRVIELSGGPAIAPPNLRAINAPLPIILHASSSAIFCLLGALQFLPRLRRHAPATHRTLGRIVVAAGLASALTGLWMTHAFAFPDALQGTLLYAVRMTLGLAMCALLIRAVCAIRHGQTPAHHAAMIRAYAIGQGASTQAVFGLALLLATGTEPWGIARDVLMVGAWIFNLVVAEALILRAAPSRAQALNIR